MRLRLTFAKTGSMRFTGHLDLQRAWERTMRRANLPLTYSQGYNPRPLLQLASALPLGFTSQAEVLDLWLEVRLPLGELRSIVERALPAGIQLLEITEVEAHAPALQTQVEAAEFVITFLDPFPELDVRLEALLRAKSLPRERRGKPYDLRPLLLNLQTLEADEHGRQRLFALLCAQEGATGRPDELIDALGFPPEAARVHRTGLIFYDAHQGTSSL